MAEKLSEGLAVVATVDPDAYSTGAQSTDYVDMEEIRRVIFIVQAGIIAASGTLDFKLQEATTATGSGVADITGFSITQLDTGSNDGQAIVEIHASELTTGKRFVKGVMTFTTAGGDAGVIALGGLLRYRPASSYDLASVAEIVS